MQAWRVPLPSPPASLNASLSDEHAWLWPACYAVQQYHTAEGGPRAAPLRRSVGNDSVQPMRLCLWANGVSSPGCSQLVPGTTK
jgi:hypothetical protein